jgi:hypothetical protein
LFRDFEIIVCLAVKIREPTALDAKKMVMGRTVRIKPPGHAVAFRHINDFDFRKCEKGSVDRIKGNIWKFSVDFLEYFICGRMIFRFCQHFENSGPLGRHLQVMGSAFFCEKRYSIHNCS